MQPHCRITQEPIGAADVLNHVGGAEDGAVLVFLGQVRNHHDGKLVSAIRYEAYEAMALTELERIAAQVGARLGVDRVAVVHRWGDLLVGDVSVAVGVSSPHRAEAFEAAATIMEEIKRRVPVWKYERYADGTSVWVRGTPVEIEDSVSPEAPS